ncbi:MAG TPA: class I SAM-dependent methyltransferase [Acidimicrobiales bacterium]|nr:class I SAM-dependent methyltransferase [Acidimicrobiales bacterium]
MVNVGAGTGSYESASRTTVAVELARTMIDQRDPGVAVVQAGAEAMPFVDGAFDAATAFITIHHWTDWRAGLREMRRVAPRVLLLGIDLRVMEKCWLVADYFPQFDASNDPVSVTDAADELDGARVIAIPTPHDCADGFFMAYWRRPEAYLDPAVRACISGLARATAEELQPGLTKLAADLKSGAWRERYADLLERETLDTGMRLIVAG